MPADLSGIMSQAETEQAQYLQQAGCPTAKAIGSHNAAVADVVDALKLNNLYRDIVETYKVVDAIYPRPVEHNDWATLRDQNIEQFIESWWDDLAQAVITVPVIPPRDVINRIKPWPFPNAPKDATPPPPPAVPPQRTVGIDCDGPHKPMQPRPTPQRTIPAWPTHDPLAALYAPYEPPV